MAAVFTKRIISSAKMSHKLRLFLNPKELSCCSSFNYYYPAHSYGVEKRKCNFITKGRSFEPLYIGIRQFSEDSPKSTQTACEKKKEEKKLSLIQRFKEMYKKYWYVLVPVHLATSACWFGGFYYLAKR